MKRILILIDNLSVGGGQRVVMEIVKNIDFSQFEVVVLCYGIKRNTPIEECIEQNCKVKYLNVSGSINLKDMLCVFKCISNIKPDLIHAHLGGITFALPWSFINRKPLVVTAHTIPEKAFNKKNEIQLKIGLKFGKVILVAVSEENHKRCKKYYNITDEKCRCVNNGIDIEKYKSKEHIGFRFINVATHNENKNQGMIIDSFSKLRNLYSDVYLTLVGDGPCHGEYREMVERLHLNDCIEFTGLISDPECYYEKSDIYVQSSYREAMPMSVLEAMAAGLPIVATNVGGLSDIVKSNGELITAGDSNGLFEAMKKMRELNEESLEAMKIESRKVSKLYSSKSMTKKYMSIYEEMIK